MRNTQDDDITGSGCTCHRRGDDQTTPEQPVLAATAPDKFGHLALCSAVNMASARVLTLSHFDLKS